MMRLEFARQMSTHQQCFFESRICEDPESIQRVTSQFATLIIESQPGSQEKPEQFNEETREHVT